MIKASVIGATGYAGEELVRLLLRHPQVTLDSLVSRSFAGQPFSSVYPNFRNLTHKILSDESLSSISEHSDVVFLALPHGIASKDVTADVLKKTKIIDLGADFRLHDANIYSQWYQVEHHGEDLLKKAVYGLCELHRDDIVGARLIANPGCYTTCSILAMAPLMAKGLVEPKSIVIDAASGVTGAGRSLVQRSMFCEVDEDFKAYKVASHRHTPEIEQELGLLAREEVTLNFTPHLAPMNRGILATCYASLKEGVNMTQDQLEALYRDFYAGEYFIRLTGSTQPETKYVKGSNFVDIGCVLDARTGRVIITSALDNLIKGAAGQAVQNMNLLFGFGESEGIDMIPDFPC